ncbi:MAG: extracellular solute-binding protein [Treponema sp.]|jgi:ABC-type glycerol-3-phosphate transport system substrate-binding protein|nr:extracellular solute-binding protein [Treponema sp.]
MKMKAIFVVVLLIVLSIVSCQKSGNDGVASSISGFTSSDPIYMVYDLSKPVTIYLYMLGDIPADLNDVITEANEKYFKPILNTTVEMQFLAWSDYEIKYPLILAGGDEVDIIYTSSWAFYDQESIKGSFLELTDDFIAKWMPVTEKEQPVASWLNVKIDGKIYCVPKMHQNPTVKAWAIRRDLREKYGLPRLTDWDSLENYLVTIAKKESGIRAYAAAGENSELQDSYLGYKRILGTNYPVFFAWQGDEVWREPVPEELTFRYVTEWYTDFALKMAEFASKGVWSKNVMNNTIPTRDAFLLGSSASLFWMADVTFALGKTLEDSGLGTVEYYNITTDPDAPFGRPPLNGDCWAIAASSKNRERSALVIDLMKNNASLRNLLQGGIEGRHYMAQDNDRFTPGPEAEDYPFNCWAWALNHPETLKAAIDPGMHDDQKAIIANIESRDMIDTYVSLFRFDIVPVATEWAVISSLIEEYTASFECGIFGDQTKTKLEEFHAKLEAAGLDKLTDEFRGQYAAYIESYQDIGGERHD